MNARIAGTGIANRRRRFVPLRVAIGGGDLDLRAKTHSIAVCADEAQEKPALTCCTDIMEELDGLVQAGDHCVPSAGVENVAKRSTAMCTRDLEAGAGTGANVLELAVAEIAEDGVGFG